ncbi:MAG TPA: recombinase XerD [Xanthobacteraceae bacterium]|nr:recombinase XerD [Xanthobacteraceae bacterium]
MLFRLVRPMKRKSSRNPYYVRRIPTDVRGKATGLNLSVPVGSETQLVVITPRTQSIRISLRTSDPVEVKRRIATIDQYLEEVWKALRQGDEMPLAHKQATALGGELYRAWANGEGRERTTAMEYVPGKGWKEFDADYLEPDIWEAVLESWDGLPDDPRTKKLEEALGADPKKEPLERALGPILDRLLLSKGIGKLNADSRAMTLEAFWKAMHDAIATRKRNAEGDYSPDRTVDRFPVWQLEKDAVQYTPRVSLTGLVDSWWEEAEAAGNKISTYDAYKIAMTLFVEFIGHDDASRVTKQDVINFKDHRLKSVNSRTNKRISPKTVKDRDLSGLKTIFGWAVTNGKLKANPAEGVTLKVGKKPKLRSSGFTNDEAIAILRKASTHPRGNEKPKMFAAKKWIPWLCAYSGARVGEMIQLRKEDVRRVGDYWVMHITPEAGTVKTNEARDVVMHAHLIEMGFPEFVEKSDDGHLFLTPSKNGAVRGPLIAVRNRLGEFVREVLKDDNVAPNHGWRHRFKTVGIEVGIEHRILDAIQGQKPRSVSETYGEVSLKAQVSAISKFPRIEL